MFITVNGLFALILFKVNSDVLLQLLNFNERYHNTHLYDMNYSKDKV